MNTPKSNTPETDSALFSARDMAGDRNPPHFPAVDADFARKLERERNEALEALDRLSKTANHHFYGDGKCSVTGTSVHLAYCEADNHARALLDRMNPQ